MSEPGWYPDPQDPSRNLYFDGRAWHRNGAAPVGPSAPPPQQRRGCFGRALKTTLIAVGGFVVFATCVGVMVDSGGKSTQSSSSSSSSARREPSSSEPASSEPSSDTEEAQFDDTETLFLIFISDVRKYFESAEAAIKEAKVLCLWYEANQPTFFERGAIEIMRRHPGMTPGEAGTFIGAATTSWCREYGPDP